MSLYPRVAVLVLVLALALMGTASSVSAGDKEDVAAATAQWAKTFVDDNPDPILALYDKEAVLWGTLSPGVMTPQPFAIIS